MKKKNLTVNILKVFVIITGIFTLAAAVLTPAFVDHFLSVVYGITDGETVMPLSIYIWTLMLPFLCALWCVLRLCSIIAAGNPFSMQSVHELKVIIICCIAEVIICFAAEFIFKFYPFLLSTILVAVVCIVIAVFAAVLKELVGSAIHLREENELTI